MATTAEIVTDAAAAWPPFPICVAHRRGPAPATRAPARAELVARWDRFCPVVPRSRRHPLICTYAPKRPAAQDGGMALRLLYLVVLRVTQLIRLLRRDGNDLAVEVVMLRPEVTVLRRQVSRPALQPADRALLAGLTRACFPTGAGRGSSSDLRPSFAGTGTWCAGTGPTRTEAPADQEPPQPQLPSSSAWPRRTRPGAIGVSTGSWPGWEWNWRLPASGRSSAATTSSPVQDAPSRPRPTSAEPRPRACWPVTSSAATQCCFDGSTFCSHRARHPGRSPRYHRPSRRPLGHPTSPQLLLRTDRSGRSGEVLDPGSRHNVHVLLRRRPRIRGHIDSQDTGPGPRANAYAGAVRGHVTPGSAWTGLSVGSSPPRGDPRRLRRALQRPSSAPITGPAGSDTPGRRG